MFVSFIDHYLDTLMLPILLNLFYYCEMINCCEYTGEAMLSPLVMCGPQGLVFLKPVTLRLPHCANAVPSLGLTIKATDTEAHLSTDWDQIHLPATTTLNTVAVKVDHF